MRDAPDPAGAGWPFLVARGRTVGFRVVLAPPFLVESRLTGLLMEATGGAEPLGDMLARREVHGSAAGDFTAIFRILPAAADLVGEQGRTLLDEGSRPISLTEGLVFRGSAPVAIDTDSVKRLHDVATDAFRIFWHADSPTARAQLSAPLPSDERASHAASAQIRNLPSIDLAQPVEALVPTRDGETTTDQGATEPDARDLRKEERDLREEEQQETLDGRGGIGGWPLLFLLILAVLMIVIFVLTRT